MFKLADFCLDARFKTGVPEQEIQGDRRTPYNFYTEILTPKTLGRSE